MKQNPVLAYIPLSLRILKITQIPLLKSFALLHSCNHVFRALLVFLTFGLLFLDHLITLAVWMQQMIIDLNT
jgi:hypothetical protein